MVELRRHEYDLLKIASEKVGLKVCAGNGPYLSLWFLGCIMSVLFEAAVGESFEGAIFDDNLVNQCVCVL